MSTNQYHKANPFPAKMIERTLLNQPGSTKKTYHIVLDLNHSGLSYEVGDAVGIFPQNPPIIVEKLLQVLGKTGEEKIKNPRSDEILSVRDFLLNKANLMRIPKELFNTISSNHPLADQNSTEDRKKFISSHDLLDFFTTFSCSEIPLQMLASLISPLLPRFYSIASSQKVVGNYVHLLVASFLYPRGEKIYGGLTSDFLCEGAILNKTRLPTYIHPTINFKLPTNLQTPILMIGPGTGVAPYRAFLQERIYQKATGKNWLIFGERNKAYDYYYQDYFTSLENNLFLKIDTAFSRDQKEKFYVQHCLLNNGKKVWEWLLDNATIYICGDAKQMAKDVLHALESIIQKYGMLSHIEAKDYIRQLKRNKKLLMDVY